MAGFPPPTVFLRAKTLAFTTALTSGVVAQVPKFFLLAPITYARTGTWTGFTLNASTGEIAATSPMSAGQQVTLTGTAAGSDGVSIPWTANLTGAGTASQSLDFSVAGNSQYLPLLAA